MHAFQTFIKTDWVERLVLVALEITEIISIVLPHVSSLIFMTADKIFVKWVENYCGNSETKKLPVKMKFQIILFVIEICFLPIDQPWWLALTQVPFTHQRNFRQFWYMSIPLIFINVKVNIYQCNILKKFFLNMMGTKIYN